MPFPNLNHPIYIFRDTSKHTGIFLSTFYACISLELLCILLSHQPSWDLAKTLRGQRYMSNVKIFGVKSSLI